MQYGFSFFTAVKISTTILSFILLVLQVCAFAQTKTVTLSQAGTLSTFISAQEKTSLTELTINGPMNGTDLSLLRYMCQEDYGGKLEILNLTNAKIVSGGKPYFADNEKAYFTQDDIIGPNMFRFWSNLKTISLPKEITKIESGAFMGCLELETVNAYAALKSIGEKAFNSCFKLKTIRVNPPHDIELSPKVFDRGISWQDIIK